MARGLMNRQQSGNASSGSDFLTLRDAMDRLFQDSFVWPRALMGSDMLSHLGNQALDIFETADDLVVKTALPGIKPEEVDIQVQGDQLIIHAQHAEQEKDQENVTYHYRGMSAGEYHRQITLPMSIDTNKVEANFENGVLTIRLPKAEEVKPKKIQIKAGGVRTIENKK